MLKSLLGICFLFILLYVKIKMVCKEENGIKMLYDDKKNGYES